MVVFFCFILRLFLVDGGVFTRSNGKSKLIALQQNIKEIFRLQLKNDFNMFLTSHFDSYPKL